MTDQDRTETRFCVRCLVAGRVQGVFFRASAREEALKHGVTGYARNLVDGRVEVLACGSKGGISAMKTWLRHGPPGASVTGVACEPETFQSLSGFSTR